MINGKLNKKNQDLVKFSPYICGLIEVKQRRIGVVEEESKKEETKILTSKIK